MSRPDSSFTCLGCGACCRWPGSVLLEPSDIAAAAAHFDMGEEDWIGRYARLARNRAQLTLKEAPDGACIFLEADNRCRIYGARPRQCRDFPATWQVEGCPALDRLKDGGG